MLLKCFKLLTIRIDVTQAIHLLISLSPTKLKGTNTNCVIFIYSIIQRVFDNKTFKMMKHSCTLTN